MGLFWVTACAPQSPEFPIAESTQVESSQVSTVIGGAVFVDADQNGAPTNEDAPVSGIAVAPLTGTTSASGGISYFDDVNAETAQTSDTGTFTLNYRVSPEVAGLRLALPAPLGETDATGYLSLIRPLEIGSLENAVALDELPRDCSGRTTEEADTVGCGSFLAPDLVPIVRWDQIDPLAKARLTTIANGQDPAALGPAPLGPAAPRAETTESSGLLPPETWFVDTDTDGRTLLRFSSVTANLGEGPLDIIAETPLGADPGDSPNDDAPPATTTTWQRMWSDTWHYRDTPSGEFVFHASHDHIHFDAFERYRLLDQNGQVVAESAKVSFCLRDSLRVSDEPPPTTGIFGLAGECGAVEQAINPGYADYYNEHLPDQWIDISDVPPGTYNVEITVDPFDVIIESDETNNSATFEVVVEPS